MKLDSEFFLTGNSGNFGEAQAMAPEQPVDPIDCGSSALASMMQQLIDDLPEQMALLDDRLTILAVNKAWTDACVGQGYLNAGPGDSYRVVCAARAAEGYEPAVLAVEALDDIAEGKRDSWQLMYNGSDVWSGRDYHFSAHRIQVGDRRFISITRADITELLQLRRLRSEFSDCMLRGQAEERRRLGRELHDSTSQLLASVGLLLGRLKRQHPQPEWLGVVDELQGLVRDAQKEIRSITFLTHPPVLDQMGLTEALSALVQGMGRRTGLKVTFEVRGDPVSLSTGLQGAIYRVAQECLSNVQRHSHAKKARVCLCFRKCAVHLVVADNGLGMPTPAASRGMEGVGLAGMRSRLAEMGGRLSIMALQTGTAVTASMRYRVAQPASKNAALTDFAA